MEVDRNGLEVLDRRECLRLLASKSMGRLGLNARALPVILPVNFLLDGERILVRTGHGSKLDAAVTNAVVAFEVDEIEGFSHTGWSVSVTGVAREVTDPETRAEAMRLPIAHWANGDADHVLAISTDIVTGRRIPYGHVAVATAT